jgi:hypothetical protein
MAQTSPLNVRVTLPFKESVEEMLAAQGQTVSQALRQYLEKRVAAWKAHGAESRQEVFLWLKRGLYEAALRKASALNLDLDTVLVRAIEDWLGDKKKGQGGFFSHGPWTYGHFQELVSAVREAYLEGVSPIDKLITVYSRLPQAEVPHDILFAAAIQAVPVREVLAERIRQGLEAWTQRQERRRAKPERSNQED